VRTNSLLYEGALILSGCLWFVIAGYVGTAVPIFGDLWLPHLIDAIITSLILGNLIRPWLPRCFGSRKWYLLPFFSILIGAALFGFLLPVSWQVMAWLKHEGGVDFQAYYQLPFGMVIYSMTVFLMIFYPLALFTNWIMYQVNRSK
jgi:hypothetical protein